MVIFLLLAFMMCLVPRTLDDKIRGFEGIYHLVASHVTYPQQTLLSSYSATRYRKRCSLSYYQIKSFLNVPRGLSGLQGQV